MGDPASNLVSVDWLAARLDADDCCVFDCRFNLVDPAWGRKAWLEGHVPGAVFADLDRDVAAPISPTSGRHPLPEPSAFAEFLARSGWRPGRKVVAYDAQGGALAARLWWLMRYFGHPDAALLDGGWTAWVAAGLPVASGEERPDPEAPVSLAPDASMVLATEAVIRDMERGAIRLLDARDAERFAGRTEPIDPIAGHVPGAVNRPFSHNLDGNGRFRTAESLGTSLNASLQDDDPASVVHMCGSGVTACHNQFAMELAGLAGSRVYVGSWSEWIRDPARPVAGED